MRKLCVLLFCLFCCIACRHAQKRELPVSVYFWKTSSQLDSAELRFLREGQITKIYCRFFDLVFDLKLGSAAPEAPLRGPNFPKEVTIVPVVFIRNEVFVRTHKADLPALVQRCAKYLKQVAANYKLPLKELQIDCDWTESSRDRYFTFLELLKQELLRSGDMTLGVTLRLHQVKYRAKQGIPPADEAVLMLYNMGSLPSETSNSILDLGAAERYIPYLRNYPLPLSAALPIFSWAVVLRGGHAKAVLRKSAALNFSDGKYFQAIDEKRFRVVSDMFFPALFLKQDDIIKLESADASDLRKLKQMLLRQAPGMFRELIFFDLAKENTAKYDEEFFKEMRNGW